MVKWLLLELPSSRIIDPIWRGKEGQFPHHLSVLLEKEIISCNNKKHNFSSASHILCDTWTGIKNTEVLSSRRILLSEPDFLSEGIFHLR